MTASTLHMDLHASTCVLSFLQREGREKTDYGHCFCQTIPNLLEQREREVIANSLGKPGFKVHIMCIWVSVRCEDSGHGDSATLLCLKLN